MNRSIQKFVMTFVLIVITAMYVFAQNTYYVSTAGSDANAGTLAAPFRTIQKAVNTGVSSDVIKVALGTYTESVVVANKALTIYGGYAADFSSRNSTTNITVVSSASASNPVFNLQDAHGITIDGFDIKNGFRGIFLSQAIYPSVITGNIISNNIIESNTTTGQDINGGGILLIGDNNKVLNNVIKNNVAYRGAAIAGQPTTNVLIQGNTIQNNSGYGDHAGGVYLSAGSGVVTNNIISGNSTGNGITYGYGGGILVLAGTHTVSYNKIFNNHAPTSGGGLFVDEADNAIIDHNLIYGNTANGGAGIYVGESFQSVPSTALITNCTIANNVDVNTTTGGAAIRINHSNVTVKNTIIWGNTGDEFLNDQPVSNPMVMTYSISQALQSGTGNKATDPLFANAAGADFHERSTIGRWDPATSTWVVDAVTSPAIDAGDPSFTYTLEPTPNGSIINMGVYGNTAEASKTGPAGTDTTPPVVAITAPASGASVSGTIAVSANASDNIGVIGVQFLVDGNNTGSEDVTSPYSISYNTTLLGNGSHTFAAKARDAAGNITTSAVVTVTSNNCTFTLAPQNITYAPAATTGTVSVTGGPSCTWTATSSAAWITITSGTSGTGNGTVAYSVAANAATTARSASITIGTQTVAITQAGSGNSTCFTTSGAWVNNPMGTQTSTFVPQFDATPSAAPTNDIIGISNGSQSSLTGLACIVLFDTDGKIKARNGASYPASTISYVANTVYHFRLTVDIVAHTYSAYVTPAGGSEVTIGINYAFRTEQSSVTQLDNWTSYVNTGGAGVGTLDVCNFTLGTPACSYSIAPANASVVGTANTGTVAVSAAAGCSWTASSNVAWITITAGAAGTGSGTVSYSVAANAGGARSGTLTIGGQTFTVNQADPNACNYTVAPLSSFIGLSAGTGNVTVTAGATCNWTAVSNDNWITITGGGSGTGNGTVSYSVSAAASARTGTMTIAGQTVTINQTGGASGTTYDVGPGQPFTTIGAVPWYTLGPGDVVRIHYQPTPYYEIINISTRGTAANPISVIGIPGPNGEQPIIDGNNATVSSNMHFAFPTGTPSRGLIVVGPQSGYTYGFKPGYINISNLLIRNCHPQYSFTDANAAVHPYTNNASGIYVERGEHIKISNCTLTASANGLFVSSNGDEATQSRDLLIKNNYIYGNGISGSYYQHNIYTECIGIVYEYNHFGNTVAGSQGSVLKDRSAGTVIRYNWIESSQGGHMLDLVDPQEGAAIEVPDPSFHYTYVYGNLLYNGPQPQGSSLMIHYGGDDGISANYRANTLYFYNNTVVIECDQSGTGSRYATVVFQLDSDIDVADIRNNIIYSKSYTPGAVPTQLTLLYQHGTANFTNNWVSPGWVTNNGGGVANGTGNFFTDPANNPGFVSLASQDFRLAAGSNAIDKGTALSSAVFTNPAGQNYDIMMQYVKHQAGQARTSTGTAPDFGAYEYSSVSCQYGISPLTASYNATVDTGNFSVIAGAGCSWTAVSNNAWITITGGSSGTANGTVTYSLTANAGAVRTGTITAAGQTFTITQAAPATCSYSLSPSGGSFAAAGSTGSTSVSASAGCPWSATSNVAWVTITSGSSGSGTGSVNFTVAANAGSSARAGTLTIAGQTYNVSQSGSGCTSISTASGFVNASFATQTGTFTAQIDATPSVSPSNDLIALSNGSQNALTGFACLVLFDTDGKIKARNGATYPASTISYSAGISYHLRIVVDIAAHTYSVYVTPSGGSELTVGLNYAFRTEQNTVTQLNNWAAYINPSGGSGTLDACNFSLGTPSCTYSIAPTSASVAASASTGNVAVTATAGCAWTATSNAAWITITAGTSGTGNGTVNYSVAANAGTAQSGTLTIAGQTFTINQAAAACTYSIAPTSASVAASASTGSVAVTATAGCAWTATSNAAWLTITAGASGTGNGTVNYSVAANTGSLRSGTLTIAGQTFTVNQVAAACTYSIAPTSASVAASASTGSVAVTASAGCAWTATSNAAWLTITAGASGTGNGTVNYSVAANAGALRSGTLTIAGQTFTVNQAAATCTYSIAPTSASVAASASTGTVAVTAAAGCAWTATSNAAWLTITAGANGTGNGTVNYSVAANAGNAQSGTLTIAGQTFTVNQAGTGSGNGVDFYMNETAPPVSFTIYSSSAVIAAEGLTGSNCVKYTGLSGWAKTPAIHYAAAKDISALPANGKLRISIDMSPATPATSIGINFNGRYDVYAFTPTIDNVTGFQTFDVDISSIRTAIGNTINDIYFQAGGGFPSNATLWVDEIRFLGSILPGGRSSTSEADNVIRKETDFTELTVYPNPANGELTVLLSEPTVQSISLTLIDTFGKTHGVYTVKEGSGSYQISTSEVASGIYFILIPTSKGIVREKVVVVH